MVCIDSFIKSRLVYEKDCGASFTLIKIDGVHHVAFHDLCVKTDKLTEDNYTARATFRSSCQDFNLLPKSTVLAKAFRIVQPEQSLHLNSQSSLQIKFFMLNC